MNKVLSWDLNSQGEASFITLSVIENIYDALISGRTPDLFMQGARYDTRLFITLDFLQAIQNLLGPCDQYHDRASIPQTLF